MRKIIKEFFKDDFMNMDPEAMTEDQQLAWALRMSMQEGPSAKSSEPAEKAKTAGVSDKITIANEMEIDQIPEEKEVTAVSCGLVSNMYIFIFGFCWNIFLYVSIYFSKFAGRGSARTTDR